MRSLFVIAVVALLTVAVTGPVQAQQKAADVTFTIPCEIDANMNVVPNLPQEPVCSGPPVGGWWLSMWAYIMNTLYFYHLDVI